MGIEIATAVSKDDSASAAGKEIAASLGARLGGAPSLLAVYASEALAQSELVSALVEAFPEAGVFGGTTCRGVITETGVHLGTPGVAGVLAIRDGDGSYGTGMAAIADDPEGAARVALQDALDEAGRSFESPSLVWICQPPGVEEAVLRGIAALVGPGCPIMGGSSADEQIAGRWRQFGRGGAAEDSVSVAALFPSTRLGVAFQSGYAPTPATCQVTGGHGRRIESLNGRKAAEVYAQLSSAEIDSGRAGLILAESTHTPLGRKLGTVGGVDEFILAHPASIEADGSITVFADVEEGDELVAMRGDLDSLIDRAGRVAGDASKLADTRDQTPVGGLVIYCGGCMMAVSDRLNDVAAGLRSAMRGAPFLTAFTFGEQGATLSGGNRHGNLMVASSVLSHEQA